MKKSHLVKVVFLVIAATQLSGCIVRPWRGDEDRGHHYGEHHHRHHDEDWDHGDRY